MIHFVWIIIKDTPVAGMRFIKMTDDQERERLEKFYGWLSGPISEFTHRVQDIILEETKYYYHAKNEVLFVVGTDLDETSIPTIFIPELEDKFSQIIPPDVVTQFDGQNIANFIPFNNVLAELVNAFDKRKIEGFGTRKELDAFEVLNLPNEYQMVALVLVKMQVVTPEMVSQVTGIPIPEVDKQLRDIYKRGYLYITTISNKSYYSVKPFEADEQPLPAIGPITTSKTPDASKPSFQFTDASQPILDVSDLETETTVQSDISSESIQPPKIKPKLDQPKERVSIKREPRSMKLKVDPIAQEIDKSHRISIVISKNGHLPQASLRREKTFISGKIRKPSEKGNDPFLLNSLFRRDLENVYEALFMGDLIVVTSDQQEIFEDDLVNNLLSLMNLFTPHRDLQITKSYTFIHPKDADVIVVPKDLIKYYSWATIIDLDTSKISGGNSSDFTKNLVKKLRKITDPKEFLREITNSCSVLLKISRDINTLKIEGRSPDVYLNEVKKAFGVAVLDAGLALSERLIRLYKDCAYIAGFYIRKGLDVAVRAILTGEPIVVIGDNPLDVYHIIESLAIFAPHKTINAQIWTTNFAEINLDEFDIMGAQEGTDKLFKNAIKVNIQSMSAYGGSRSEYLHNFLRKMWRRRSKERPKFIRDQVNEIMDNANKIIQQFRAYGDVEPTKQDVRDIFNEYDPNFAELIVDLFRNEEHDIAMKIKNSI
jgi:hypothetical protein